MSVGMRCTDGIELSGWCFLLFIPLLLAVAAVAAVADVLILVHKQNFTSTKYDYEHENFASKIYLAKTLAE